MSKDIKLIASRRAYEFPPDALRLTMLSLDPIVGRIQEVFKFQFAQVGTPQATFGPVAQTLPPGLVFSMGTFASEGSGLIPIRLLHFEPRRIVIDVAGPSSSLDEIFAGLKTMLGELTAPDGSPAIGILSNVRNQSEISARYTFELMALLAPNLGPIVKQGLGVEDDSRTLIPSLAFQVQQPQDEYIGTGPVVQTNGPMMEIALRQGTLPGEHIYYSIAPLDSEAHIAYLSNLEASLGSEDIPAQPAAETARRRRGSKATAANT